MPTHLRYQDPQAKESFLPNSLIGGATTGGKSVGPLVPCPCPLCGSTLRELLGAFTRYHVGLGLGTHTIRCACSQAPCGSLVLEAGCSCPQHAELLLQVVADGHDGLLCSEARERQHGEGPPAAQAA